MKSLWHLTRLETLSFLRSKTALFWTFAYPVVLLVLLHALFGQPTSRLTVEIDDRSPSMASTLVTDILEERLAYIDGIEMAFVKTDGKAPVGNGVIRITFPQEATREGAGVIINFKPPVSPEVGSAISMISESVEYLNRKSIISDPPWTLSYAVTDTSEDSGNNGARFLITGLAALTIITTALFGFTGVLIQLRHGGALRPFQVMPVKRLEYILAFSASRALVLLVFSLCFIYLADLVYDSGMDLSLKVLGLTALASAIGIFAFLGMGLVMAAFITSPTTGQAVINTLNMPVIFLSDLFIPIKSMPEWLQEVVSFSPIYAFVNLLRSILGGEALSGDELQTLLILFVLGIVAFGLAMKSFKWRVS